MHTHIFWVIRDLVSKFELLRSEGVGVAKEGLVPGRSVQHLHPTRNEKKKSHRIDGSAENEHTEVDRADQEKAGGWEQVSERRGTQPTNEGHIRGHTLSGMGRVRDQGRTKNKLPKHIPTTASKQMHPNGHIRAFYTNACTDTHRHDCRGTQRHRCATQTLRQTHTDTHKGTQIHIHMFKGYVARPVWPMCFPRQGCLNIMKQGKKPKFC